MKDTCFEIAPLLAALAEDHESVVPDPHVARHLAECGACQRSLRLQREMHGLLRARAGSLQERAPESLRARLTSQVVAARPAAARRWAPLRMPVAATMLLAFLGVATYGVTSASSTVLAAQLTLDHLKCMRLVSPGGVVNPVQAVKEWAQRYDWTPRVPAPPAARKASLVGVRRCLYGHGHLAHLLYEVDGHTVSVFVMPRSEYPVGATPARHDFLGQHAEMWASGEQSFAVVGDVPSETLASMAAEFRAAE
jgi:anti-sigma factor RsiW